jgi:hypothetical protein
MNGMGPSGKDKTGPPKNDFTPFGRERQQRNFEGDRWMRGQPVRKQFTQKWQNGGSEEEILG